MNASTNIDGKDSDDKNHLLFSYGTLQLERVQIENYGRILTGKKDSLPGYLLDKLVITDQRVLERSGLDFHPIAIKTDSPNDLIEGTAFEITTSELEETDRYEVSDYKRVIKTLSSGRQAWVYVARQKKPPSTQK